MEAATQEKELSLLETLKILFGASKAFWLVNMVNFGDGIAYFGVLTLLTRFLGADLGMTDQMSGFSVSLFTGLVTLFMFGGGFVSDKLGVRNALTFSLAIMLIGRAGLVLSPKLLTAEAVFPFDLTPAHVSALISLVLLAFGSGVIQPALYAGIKEFTDPRTASVGYGLLYAIMNLGIVAENFLSPFVRANEPFMKMGDRTIHGLGLGIQGVYWMVVGITALMLVVHLALFTGRVEKECRLTANVMSKEDAAAEAAKSWQQKLAELPFLDMRFMFFIFILLPVRTLFAHQFLTMPDYIFRAFPPEVGAKFEWINGLNPLIIVIFVPTIAAMTRKVSVLTMMIIGSWISALTTFMLVPGPNLNSLLLYVIIFSFGEAVWSSRFLEYVADLAPAGKIGAYMGLAGIPWFLAKFTTGLYSGYMLNRFCPAPETSWLTLPQSILGGDVGTVLGLNHVMAILPVLPQGVDWRHVFNVLVLGHDTSTLWMIYGCIACISPIGLMLGKSWIEAANKHAADAAKAAHEAKGIPTPGDTE